METNSIMVAKMLLFILSGIVFLLALGAFLSGNRQLGSVLGTVSIYFAAFGYIAI